VRPHRADIVDRQARVEGGHGPSHITRDRGRIAIGPDDVGHRTSLPETIWDENLRREVFNDAAQPEMADDANDRARALGRGLADAEPLADGALSWPQPLGQPVIDDQHQVRKALLFSEEPSFEQLNAERFEQP